MTFGDFITRPAYSPLKNCSRGFLLPQHFLPTVPNPGNDRAVGPTDYQHFSRTKSVTEILVILPRLERSLAPIQKGRFCCHLEPACAPYTIAGSNTLHKSTERKSPRLNRHSLYRRQAASAKTGCSNSPFTPRNDCSFAVYSRFARRPDKHGRIAGHFRLIPTIAIAQVMNQSLIFQPTAAKNVDCPDCRQYADRASSPERPNQFP